MKIPTMYNGRVSPRGSAERWGHCAIVKSQHMHLPAVRENDPGVGVQDVAQKQCAHVKQPQAALSLDESCMWCVVPRTCTADTGPLQPAVRPGPDLHGVPGAMRNGRGKSNCSKLRASGIWRVFCRPLKAARGLRPEIWCT